MAGESRERDEKSGKERRMKNQGRFLDNANPSFKAQIKCLCLKKGLQISSPGWSGVLVHLLVPEIGLLGNPLELPNNRLILQCLLLSVDTIDETSENKNHDLKVLLFPPNDVAVPLAQGLTHNRHLTII